MIITPSSQTITALKLTPTESRVACAICNGHSIAEIAGAIGIQTGTVRVHLRAIFRKLRINRQTSLAVMLLSAEIESLREQLHQKQHQVEATSQALETASVALDDWLNDYAHDMCDPARVAEARQRLHERGTIGYIAQVQEKVRNALENRGKEQRTAEAEVTT